METHKKLLAAGVLPICVTTQRVLLSKRKDKADFGGTWASWGGKFEAEKGDKTIEDCAKREFREETMIEVDYTFVERAVHVYEDDRVVYHTYLGIFENEVDPDIAAGGEMAGYEWFHIDELPEPLMPEFKIMLDAELQNIKEFILKMKTNGKGE